MNEIKGAYSQYQIRKKKNMQASNNNSRNDSILENLYQNLLDLEEDINIQSQPDMDNDSL